MAAAFDRLKESAGVVVAFATDVVNRGERLPELNEETVPPPDNPSHDFTAPRVAVKLVSPCSNFTFAPPHIAGCAYAPKAAQKRIEKIIAFFMF